VPAVPWLVVFVRLLVRLLLTRLHLLLLLGVSLFHLLRLLLMTLLYLLLLYVVGLTLRHLLVFLILLALKFLPLLILLGIHLLFLLLVFPIDVRISRICGRGMCDRRKIFGVDRRRRMTFSSTFWPCRGSVAASFFGRHDTAIIEGSWSGCGRYRRLSMIF